MQTHNTQVHHYCDTDSISFKIPRKPTNYIFPD